MVQGMFCRQGGKGKEKEEEKYQCVVVSQRPPLGTWPLGSWPTTLTPTTLAGNRTHEPLVRRPAIHWATPAKAHSCSFYQSMLNRAGHGTNLTEFKQSKKETSRKWSTAKRCRTMDRTKNGGIASLELVSWSELPREKCGQNRMNETEKGKEGLWSLAITRSSNRSANKHFLPRIKKTFLRQN